MQYMSDVAMNFVRFIECVKAEKDLSVLLIIKITK